MSDLLTQWILEHGDEHGHYAGFVGFETEIRKSAFGAIYDQLEIDQQTALFGFVWDLLNKQIEAVRDE